MKAKGETPPSASLGYGAASPFEEPRLAIRGQCQRCRRWFDCDEWFDSSVPLPVCPTCQLTPQRLDYLLPSEQGRRLDRAANSELWLG